MKNQIFHQAVRYTYARQAVNLLRTKNKHKILEVGAGPHARLAEYLPEDAITFLDIDLPEETLKDARFVAADATDLFYENDSFDFVIALDVIEHIPIEKRSAFISSIHRTAKQGVVLSAPFDSAQNPYDDSLLKSFYVLCGADPPVWIDEHVACTLPAKEDILSLVKAQGVSEEQILSFYGEDRRLMQKMLIMEAAAAGFEGFQGFFGIVNADYMQSILEADFGITEQEATKLYIVWTKAHASSDWKTGFQSFHTAGRRKAVKEFEKKYSELMIWAAGLLNAAAAIKLQGRWDLAFPRLLELNASAVSHQQESIRICREIQNQSHAVLDRMNGLLEQKKRIRLNVVLVTYNHEEFIKETLGSILMQQTNFNFNILVADDCSNDNTTAIIREMEQQTQIPFVYLPNNKNLGIMQNYKRSFAACDAEYAAVIEGDDLWTDACRLQKHVDFLDSHCECAMSFNQYLVKDYGKGTVNLQPRFSDAEEQGYYRYLSGHDLAYSNLIGNFSACVYRCSALRSLPEQMYDIDCYDWLTNIMVSKMGYIGCLIQPMGIYRVHAKGVWSGQTEKEKIESVIKAIDGYDAFTDREFSEGFAAHKARLQASLAFASIKKQGRGKAFLKKSLRAAVQITRYLPPVFVYAVKLLVPVRLKEIIIRHL